MHPHRYIPAVPGYAKRAVPPGPESHGLLRRFRIGDGNKPPRSGARWSFLRRSPLLVPVQKSGTTGSQYDDVPWWSPHMAYQVRHVHICTKSASQRICRKFSASASGITVRNCSSVRCNALHRTVPRKKQSAITARSSTKLGGQREHPGSR